VRTPVDSFSPRFRHGRCKDLVPRIIFARRGHLHGIEVSCKSKSISPARIPLIE
jgi:GDP-mannose transporter